MPRADAAVFLGKVLDITVEELVLGEEGRAFVLDWAGRNGAQWRPPPDLEDLCADLKKLDKSGIDIVHAAVKKIIEVSGKDYKKNTDSEETPQASAS